MTELEKFNEGKDKLWRIREYLFKAQNAARGFDWEVYEASRYALEFVRDHDAKHFDSIDRMEAVALDLKAKDERLAVLESENVRLKAILADVKEVVGNLEAPKEFSNAALAEGWRSATVTATTLLKWALGDKDRR